MVCEGSKNGGLFVATSQASLLALLSGLATVNDKPSLVPGFIPIGKVHLPILSHSHRPDVFNGGECILRCQGVRCGGWKVVGWR